MAARPAKTAGFIATPREDVCLDFVNTRSWRGRETPGEELHGLDDVLAWARGAGGVDVEIAQSFQDWWRPRPRAASAVFTEAIALREALFRLFEAVSSGEAPDPAALDVLNAALGSAAPRSRVAPRADALVWSVDGLVPGMAALLSPVLWSASDLLAGTRRRRVRLCANPQCRWVFLDDSKSGTRRWCSMASCGNRAKAHRHYLKRRKATHAEENE
ncbi:MAG: ABATE domain-containing protein [Acetobacteraceae bacterium]|nr:ABATE domain-containing protein [Acetobacteraceae bacterium]